jgi:sterol desaturase/sphingolipid hydroxylase (fatty acid hydroxylase superfamily)
MQLPTNGALLFGLFFAFAVVVNLASIGLWSAVEALLRSSKRIYDVPLREGQLVREMLGNALFILIFAAGMTLLFLGGRIEVAPGGFGAAALTFFGAMLSFDLYYYALHTALHNRLLAPVHDWHHRSRVNTPWTALSLSPMESAFWVLGLALWPLLTSTWLPFVPEAYAGWLVFFWVSNTMGHINVEIVPASVSASPVTSWLSHAITYHALHHARYQKHYCFFLNSLDGLFGQVWDDYPEMHARVDGGRPLTRLGERGEAAAPQG